MTVVIVKYASAVIIAIAMVLHTAGITPWNSLFQICGAVGWCYVAYKWKEPAIFLNFVPQFLIIIPMLVYIYVIQ
jgi:hypothetical protein